MTFKSTILILPGLGGSGLQHWQSVWEDEHNFIRVEQQDWDNPNREEWVETINNTIKPYDDPSNVILVAHSLACTTVAYWAQKYGTPVKGALLVAPSDTEAETFPQGTTGFTPVPLLKLPFKSIVVTSTNDQYVTTQRANLFAHTWGSELVNIGEAGHINIASGFGKWDEGLEILKRLDK
jgi:predicted alpha/beta hydrolase family esterase